MFPRRYGFIGASDKCRLCSFPLLTRQFYLFSCQHCFHADCLTSEVLNNMSLAQRARVMDLQQRLQQEVRSTERSHALLQRAARSDAVWPFRALDRRRPSGSRPAARARRARKTR